jgi:glycosyltransferase involved in cell wall biosynthesis
MTEPGDCLSSTDRCAKAPLLTVIMPVLNESETVDEALAQVLAAPYDKQVIVVDDGSSDATPALLKRWSGDERIIVLTHPVNRGKGAAIRTALALAIGRFSIVQDADLETNPKDYPKLIEPLLAGEADFVIGSRFVGKNVGGSHWDPFRLGVGVLNFCVRQMYNVRLTDEACCYKALSTENLRAMNLQCERFEFCPEVVAKACRMGLRIREVPVDYTPRTRAAGKKIRYRDGLVAIQTLWRYRKWSSTGATMSPAVVVASPGAAASPAKNSAGFPPDRIDAK